MYPITKDIRDISDNLLANAQSDIRSECHTLRLYSWVKIYLVTKILISNPTNFTSINIQYVSLAP